MTAKLDRFDPFFFEDAQNGQRAWSEAGLMEFLGYRDRRSFRKVVKRAIQAWVSLGNDPGRDFILLDDNTYKFTRSACFLLSMNGDPKKERVAQAQAYFVTIGNIIMTRAEQADSLDRLVIRDEITDGMKALATTARDAGVTNYARFMDEGYRGMYNMSLDELTRKKGVPFGEKLLDRMDRTELAANLFRVTQTDQKIQNDVVRGQTDLERTAHQVGAAVRETMLKIGGTAPEHLEIAAPITQVRKEIQQANRTMQAIDKLDKPQRLLSTLPESDDEDEPPSRGFTENPDDEESRDDE